MYACNKEISDVAETCNISPKITVWSRKIVKTGNVIHGLNKIASAICTVLISNKSI